MPEPVWSGSLPWRGAGVGDVHQLRSFAFGVFGAVIVAGGDGRVRVSGECLHHREIGAGIEGGRYEGARRSCGVQATTPARFARRCSRSMSTCGESPAPASARLSPHPNSMAKVAASRAPACVPSLQASNSARSSLPSSARQAGAWGVLHGGDLAVILDREKHEMSSDDGKLRGRHEHIAVVAFRR